MNGWFLFDNNVENISQTTHQQISYIHGELDRELFYLTSSSMFLLGANVAFGLRVRFDDIDSSMARND